MFGTGRVLFGAGRVLFGVGRGFGAGRVGAGRFFLALGGLQKSKHAETPTVVSTRHGVLRSTITRKPSKYTGKRQITCDLHVTSDYAVELPST